MRKKTIALCAALALTVCLAAGALATDVNQAITEGSIEEVYGDHDGIDGSDEGIEEVDGFIAGENVMDGVEEVPVLD